MRSLVFAALLTLAGCGGSDSNDQAPTVCAPRSGSYSERFTERSGSCGALSEQIATIGQAIDPACMGDTTPDLASCRVQVNITCPEANGYSITMRGPVDWNEAGTEGHGTIQIVLTRTADSSAVCSSTYDVTLRKL